MFFWKFKWPKSIQRTGQPLNEEKKRKEKILLNKRRANFTHSKFHSLVGGNMLIEDQYKYLKLSLFPHYFSLITSIDFSHPYRLYTRPVWPYKTIIEKPTILNKFLYPCRLRWESFWKHWIRLSIVGYEMIINNDLTFFFVWNLYRMVFYFDRLWDDLQTITRVFIDWINGEFNI